MRAALLAAALGLLSACAPPSSGPELAALYGDFEYYYRADSRFRTDYDPPDAPIDLAKLEQSFLKLAFNSEAQQLNDRTIVQAEEVQLLRWPGPDVTYALIGGSPADDARMLALGTRIGDVIGLPVQPVDNVQDADIRVFVLDGPTRREFGKKSAEGFDLSIAAFIGAWVLRPEFPCIGVINTNPEDDSLAVGAIFIKDELQGDFRRACFTEEFTQVFGLINDDPDVRPSIFNDDQEFIELTRHDEYLLKMLYDPRLSPGMTEAEARPLLGQIVRDVVGQSETAVY